MHQHNYSSFHWTSKSRDPPSCLFNFYTLLSVCLCVRVPPFYVYHIARKFGGEFHLVVWGSVLAPPNLISAKFSIKPIFFNITSHSQKISNKRTEIGDLIASAGVYEKIINGFVQVLFEGQAYIPRKIMCKSSASSEFLLHLWARLETPTSKALPDLLGAGPLKNTYSTFALS